MTKYRTDFSVKVEKKNVLVKFLILIIFFVYCIGFEPHMDLFPMMRLLQKQLNLKLFLKILLLVGNIMDVFLQMCWQTCFIAYLFLYGKPLMYLYTWELLC